MFKTRLMVAVQLVVIFILTVMHLTQKTYSEVLTEVVVLIYIHITIIFLETQRRLEV